MKLILSILSIVVTTTLFAQNDAVKFEKTSFSFGKIPQNKPATTAFSFTNNSGKPVIIETATAECGCTTPDYPKAPILAGKTAVVKATYNAANPGKFTKRVTVKFANIAEPVVLTIEGEVIPAKK